MTTKPLTDSFFDEPTVTIAYLVSDPAPRRLLLAVAQQPVEIDCKLS